MVTSDVEDSGKIRLLLLDDHALFREGLSGVLERYGCIQVVGKAGSVAEAVTLLATTNPEIVLLDVDLGPERALDFIAAPKSSDFNARILVVTAGISDQEAVALIQKGVSGIFHKHSPPDELWAAILKVHAGDVYLEPRYLKSVFQSMDKSANGGGRTLSERELNVIRLLLQGLANKEIGERMNLSESSVKGVLKGLFDRLGVRTRSQLVKIALEEYRDLL